jgi:para-aminobenzoate synthetase component 1
MSMLLQLPNAPADLTDWFAKVQHLPFAMLLDSAASEHPNSRYDILVAAPFLTLVARGEHCEITDLVTNHSEVKQCAPFALLKQLQQQYFPPIDSVDQALPFMGGIAGFFGYDLGRTLEKLPTIANNDVAMPDLAVGFYRWALVLDKVTQQLWYVDTEEPADQSWPRRAQWFDGQSNSLHAESNPTSLHPFALTSAWQANMTKPEYLQKFEQIQQYLQSGDCYQINLAQRFSANYQGDEWQAYLQLRLRNAAPFSAFIRLADCAILSISPERFIEVNQRRVETKPIKGTKPRFANAIDDEQSAEALRNSPKDRAENVMIVDLLRNDLGKVCRPGTVKVPSLFAIESFPAVHHLVSTVTGELAHEHQAIDALAAAFPGGSITGAPKVRAMQIIEELEPHRRHIYCGSIGYLSAHGHMDTNIAIRTLVCANNAIYAWAGGGIVADSNGESEYQETFDKVGKILPVLSALKKAE